MDEHSRSELWTAANTRPPWRNRLARSAVNRKVGGSSPPGGASYFIAHPWFSLGQWGKKGIFFDLSRIRTCNLLIRSQTRYPLRHEAKVGPHCWAVGQVWMNRIAGKMREITGIPACFLSVVVITCPSHGQGRRFDPGREQLWSFWHFLFLEGKVNRAAKCIPCHTVWHHRVARWSRGMILA